MIILCCRVMSKISICEMTKGKCTVQRLFHEHRTLLPTANGIPQFWQIHNYSQISALPCGVCVRVYVLVHEYVWVCLYPSVTSPRPSERWLYHSRAVPAVGFTRRFPRSHVALVSVRSVPSWTSAYGGKTINEFCPTSKHNSRQGSCSSVMEHNIRFDWLRR